MKVRWVLLVAAIAACSPKPATPPAEQPQTATVYERYAALEHDAAFGAKLEAGARHADELRWMAGAWKLTITVFATPSSPERVETTQAVFTFTPNGGLSSDDHSTFLVYDAFRERWVTFGSEPPMAPFNSQYAAGPWDGHTLAFEGETRILGEVFWLRQIMTKISDDEFELLNEQRVGPNQYVKVDAYHYVRSTPAPE